MRSVAVCHESLRQTMPENRSLQTVTFDGVAVTCGLVNVPAPVFDADALENCYKVLVRITAFSCNYRDKMFILLAHDKCRQRPNSYYAVGSEFVGVVVAVGAAVTHFKAGDRVMGNNSYNGPGIDAQGVAEGTASHQASKEFQVFHQRKLILVPAEMPDEIAAAFNVGAQTAAGMVRRANLRPGENVLVTSAKANTSLFIINALKKQDVHVVAASSSLAFADELQRMGVKTVVQVEPDLASFGQNAQFMALLRQQGPFHCIFDPFFDLHLGKVLDVMAVNGRYITCGFGDQYHDWTNPRGQRQLNQHDIMKVVFLKNLHIMGNCLGSTDDLENALVDYSQGRLNVAIDSLFCGDDVASFFERTYNTRERFGKVVYRYT